MWSIQQLNHPNVVCYIHSFVENSELQIVLELADAGDLAQLISREDSLRFTLINFSLPIRAI